MKSYIWKTHLTVGFFFFAAEPQKKSPAFGGAALIKYH